MHDRWSSSKSICQEWDLNPPHICGLEHFTLMQCKGTLESGALDHSAILTWLVARNGVKSTMKVDLYSD